MVREVGGPHIEVTSLVGPNTDSHVFNPTPADAKRIASARLVFVNGLGFEGWLDRLVKASGYRGPIVIASKGVKSPLQLKDDHHHAGASKGHGHQHSHGAPDPHAWQNLANAERYVETIRIALAAALPAHSAVFEQRAADYNKRIRALDQATKAQIATVPVERRRVITSHDAFGYFGKAYNMEVRGLQGISTLTDYGLSDVNSLVNYIVSKKIKAIFVESSVSGRAINAVLVGCKSKGWPVKIGGTLYSDALGAADKPEGTYIGMVKYNTQVIVSALK
jgi:zinc/manganese transport system substrate-binding protein